MLQLGKNTRLSYLIFAGIVLFIILLFAFAIHLIMAENIVGNDILVFYLAAKSSFIDGQGPYLSENSILSQLLSYGKLAQPGEDYLTFSYPPYALIPIWILTFLPFQWAQAIWMSTLIIGFVLAVVLLFPQAPRWLAPTTLLIYPVTFGILMGNFVIPIVIILIVNVKYFFFSNWKPNNTLEILLAISLAWATVKPQFSWLFIAFILISAFLQKKRNFIRWFFISLLLCLLMSFFIQSDWISALIKQISFYQQTNPTELQIIRFFDLFLPTQISRIIAIPFILIAILWVFYAFYQWWHKKLKTISVFVIIGWVSYLLYPGGVDYQQVVFVLPFLFWIYQWKPIKPILVTIVWVFLILFSWLEFIYVRMLGMNPGVTGWLFYGYLIWAIVLLTNKEKASDPGIAQKN
jgi:hypothetical protein